MGLVHQKFVEPVGQNSANDAPLYNFYVASILPSACDRLRSYFVTITLLFVKLNFLTCCIVELGLRTKCMNLMGVKHPANSGSLQLAKIEI